MQPLIQTLDASTSSTLSTTAAWALGGVVEDPAAARALLTALWTNPHAEVRAAAAHALARDPSKPLRIFSLWEENLAFIDPHQEGALVSVEYLVRELTQSGQHQVHADLNAFATRHSATIAAALKAALASSSGDDLLRLLRDLDSADDALGLSLTYQALIPTSHVTSAATHETLRTASLPVLSAPLQSLLADPDPAKRWHAASLLGKLRDTSAVDGLLALLSDPEPEAQRQAALALGRLGDPRAVTPLLAALENNHFGTRANAALALGLLKDPRAVDPLIKALDDSYPFVKGFAAKGLGLLGDPRAVEPLTQRLKGADPITQLEIINALVILGSREPLQGLVDSADLSVRQAARQALGMQ